MQTVQPSEKFRQKRKMLLVMPLLILPFTTLLFWTIGGEKSNESAATSKPGSRLNTQLPDAKLKSDKGLDKLSFYQQASKDSVKLLEEKRTDPYWLQYSNRDSTVTSSSGQHTPSQYQEYLHPLPDHYNPVDANEAKVYSKLDELNKALANSKRTALERESYANQSTASDNAAYSNRVSQLEEMIGRVKENKTEDPEITQLNQMLDKIAAIQNPEQAKDATLQINQDINTNEHSLVVHKKDQRVAVSTLQTPTAMKNISTAAPLIQNAFYGESNSMAVEDTIASNAIAAIIAETQTLVSGATVKLALIQDITIQGKTIPAGSHVYGTATVRNERLMIIIHSIRLDNNIIPVSLMVYDLDGLEGIYIPGSIRVNAVKQSADRVTGEMGTSLFNPSLGAQAASAGIETAKTLLNKKVKLVKVTLPAGYRVLLKDMHPIL